MLTRDENELLCQTGPGTPMGDLMRRYWIPVLFSHQLAESDGPPLRTTILSERLVAFRDSAGQVGLIAEHCPHRGASLFFGRNEEDGLRCVYHGWKYDVTGQCVDVPSEPPESTFKERIKATAYPCREQGGAVWAYLGPPALQPELPPWEWSVVPDSHIFATRRWQESNWLQAVEGGIDPSHVAFLHRGNTTNEQRGRPAGASTLSYARNAPTPMPYGFALGSAGGPRSPVSPSHFIMPFFKIIRRLRYDDPIGAHAWVPIDDENHMLWSWEWHPERPLTEDEMEPCTTWGSIHAETFPDSDRTVLNQANDYLIDREVQRSGQTYTGIRGVGMQDTAMQESMGPIQDRTQEHLSSSDIAIVTLRHYLLRTIKDLGNGGNPPGLDLACHRERAETFRSPVPLGEAILYGGSSC
jgi:phenylpropionate dioxygenase-like ring-hydroxylating dioxygenase large terminal subunit